MRNKKTYSAQIKRNVEVGAPWTDRTHSHAEINKNQIIAYDIFPMKYEALAYGICCDSFTFRDEVVKIVLNSFRIPKDLDNDSVWKFRCWKFHILLICKKCFVLSGIYCWTIPEIHQPLLLSCSSRSVMCLFLNGKFLPEIYYSTRTIYSNHVLQIKGDLFS